MLVSLAVLALALTVVGVVFTVTTQTTRRAAAYSEAQNWVRQFMLQLEEDLKYCEPSNSFLVLVGRTQAASLTRADLEAGKYYRVLVGDPSAVGGFDPEYDQNADPATNQYSDPRADLLMFLTNRQMASQAPPPNPVSGSLGDACLRGTSFSPILVAYGHAAFDEAVFNGTQYTWPAPGNEQHILPPSGDASERSPIPAGQWHLGRRATIVQRQSGVNYGPIDFTLNDRARIRRCKPDESGLQLPGDAAYFDVPNFLAMLGPDWRFKYGQPPAIQSPYNVDADVRNAMQSLLFGPGSPPERHMATVFRNPPPALRTNLGVQALPGCAWFQVEFLMPEDPRNSVDYAPNPSNPNMSQRTDMPRWTEVEQGQTYVFVPDTAFNRDLIASGLADGGVRRSQFALLNPTGLDNIDNRRIRLWPYAIRVTVRVYDPEGRLKEPIVRSLVHRFE